MTINGTVVNKSFHNTIKGNVINVFIREELPYSVIFHASLWGEPAESLNEKIQVGDTITASGYAIIDKKGEIKLAKFNLIEVKRTVVLEQSVVFEDHTAEPANDGDAND